MIPLRIAGLLLFVTALVALPLPMLGLEGSFVPAARYWQLAVACAGIIASEGSAGMIGLFAALLLAHAVVFTTLLALGSWLVVRLVVRRLPPRIRDHAVVLLVALVIAVACFGHIYDSQFHHSSAHALLTELYF